MANSRDELLRWLHRLDSYTNAEYGRSRTLCNVSDLCVACGRTDPQRDAFGLCAECARRREPDHSEIVLFRPMTRKNTPPPQ